MRSLADELIKSMEGGALTHLPPLINLSPGLVISEYPRVARYDPRYAHFPDICESPHCKKRNLNLLERGQRLRLLLL